MVHMRYQVDAYPAEAETPVLARFDDRAAAGRQLATLLRPYQEPSGIVLALTPGGVMVAGEVARALRMPVDVLLVRPFFVSPYAVPAGAICEGAGMCLNGAVWQLPDVPCEVFWNAVRAMRQEVMALTRLYRHGRLAPMWRRRVVMLVDDGLGSGLAQLAALQVLRRGHSRRCIVATPIATPEAIERVARWADVVIAPTCCPDARTEALHWHTSVSDTTAATLLEHYRQSMPH